METTKGNAGGTAFQADGVGERETRQAAHGINDAYQKGQGTARMIAKELQNDSIESIRETPQNLAAICEGCGPENVEKGALGMSIYERNATMRMIGEQTVIDFIDRHEIFSKIVDILQAHDAQAREDGRTCDYIEPALDFFALGVIYGKRAERKRRKNTTV